MNSARGELYQLSLSEQCRLIQSQELTSEELTKSHIEHIKKRNPDLNILIRDNFKAALKLARQMDTLLRKEGRSVGPLHGIPFTLKDAFRVKGLKTSYGWPGLQFLPAFDSCEMVKRLERAGAILLGQTNVPLSCFDWQTKSPIYGLTKNPLAPEKTVGGSSGGSAASVAADFSSFEFGSDVAGSIRYPAHCCGVFGFRPSHDFIPASDVGPTIHKESFANLVVAGPFARSIEDLRIPLAVASSTTAPLEALNSSVSSQKPKIAYTLNWEGAELCHNDKKSFEAFFREIKSLGFEVIEVRPEMDFQSTTEVWGQILGYEYRQMLPFPLKYRPFLNIFNYLFNERRFGRSQLKSVFQMGLFSSRTQYLEALSKAKLIRETFFQSLNDYDLWITPTSPSEAILHQKTGKELELNGQKIAYADFLGNYVMSTALLHHPILVAPLKRSRKELSIGVQIHGKPGKDWELLSHAEKFQDLFETRA